MGESDNQDDGLRTASSILIRCLVISAAFLLIWFGMVGLAGDFVYRLHSSYLDISKAHFALVHYGGMVFFKIGAIGLFLIPYIAIRLVLKKKR